MCSVCYDTWCKVNAKTRKGVILSAYDVSFKTYPKEHFYNNMEKMYIKMIYLLDIPKISRQYNFILCKLINSLSS